MPMARHYRLLALLAAALLLGACTQSITPDLSAPYSPDPTSGVNSTVLIITLTATWRGTDGHLRTLTYTTRYAHFGISDFFYTAHT